MKFISLFAVVIFLFSCNNPSERKLESDQMIQQIFDVDEIADLNTILSFFLLQICNNVNVEFEQSKACIEEYTSRLNKEASAGNLTIGISFEDQKEMYLEISESTFNELWYMGKSWNPNGDTFKSINYRHDGKFAQLLNEMSKSDMAIRAYNENFKSVGDISPGMVASLIMNLEKFNLDDPKTRFVIAMHYLTKNDQSERKERIR